MADFARWATACETALGPAGNAAAGWERPRSFCARRMIVVVATARAPAGQKIRVPSRGGYVGRRRSFACWILKYPSVERAEREPGQSLVAGLGPRPSAPSAPSARFATTCREVHKENYKLGKYGGLRAILTTLMLATVEGDEMGHRLFAFPDDLGDAKGIKTRRAA